MRAGTHSRGRLARLAKNTLAFLLGLLLVCVPLELGLRLVLRSNDARTIVYPRVATAINGFRNGLQRQPAEDEFRILALGGSAFVTRSFQPHFERLLNESPLFRERGLRVRVISTGVPAHMSWDSLWKYRYWYRGYDFDAVLFYHGINDARANCYPREVFRDDYSQFPYYRQYATLFDWMERQPLLSRSFAATLVAKLVVRAQVRLSSEVRETGPYNDPSNDRWLDEGGDIKTEATFERNVEALLDEARARRQPLLLLTYAFHLPPDYTNAGFRERRLDYSFAPESIPVEVWGLPHHVAKAIAAHNEVVRSVAARRPQALFFDMERHIPKSGEYFIDVCHWTDAGRQRFADGVLQALQPYVEAGRSMQR
ncbi:MAG: hypothetical protein JSW67_05830 [Candidatus Latescibacterota bacterium]|nr:MAG: hypothetical protein JSW67_05830 [Candidatus Latescibacterota bacterium]